MKTLEFLKFTMMCAFGALVLTACNDDDDGITNLPEAVQTALTRHYADARNVEWDREDGYYVAEFRQNGKEYDVWFTNTGEWMMTEIDHGRNLAGLPTAVQDGYNATVYAQDGWRIDDIDEIQRPEYETIYKIEVEKAGQPDYDLYFDLNGTLFREVQDNDDDRNSGMIHNGIPTEILSYINTNYPGATIVDFDREYNGYEVDIRHDGKSKEVTFDTGYNWVKTETDIRTSEIPTAILQAVNAQYPNKRIDDCEYVETTTEAYYLIDLDNYEPDLKVTLDGTITEVYG